MMMKDQFPTGRKIVWDENLEEMYKQNDVRKWYSQQCQYDSESLSPLGKNVTVVINYEYPPLPVFGAAVQHAENEGTRN